MTDNEKTLEAAVREIRGDARVFFYREIESLRLLWGLDAANLDKDSGVFVIVDLGGGTALQSDRLGIHLSALDWALLYAARETLAPVGSKRILVLDLRPGLLLNAFDTERSFLTSHVQYFAPSRGRGLGAMLDFVEALLTASAPTRPTPDTDTAAAFRSRWLASLARSDTRAGHHEMNNSLGPMLLALGDTGLEERVLDLPTAHEAKPQPTDLTSFTRSVMRKALAWACPLEPPPKGLEAAPWTPPAHCGEVRFLLLDDQAHEGWLPIVARTLGLGEVKEARATHPFREVARSGAASLWVATDPMAVLQMVCPEVAAEAGAGAGPWVAGKRLKLTASADDAKIFSEVLLLDLRLYARDATGERSFLSAVAAAHTSASCLASAWTTRIDDRGFQQTDDYLEALTCFARLITEVDFTYPIIIWSSTGQRRVTEALKAYPNIYTALEKPRLDAYTNTPQLLQSNFKVAISEALRRANDLITSAKFAGDMLEEDSTWVIPPDKKHVEIYIDESGSSGSNEFSVGALVVFYDNPPAAAALDSQLKDNRSFGPVDIVYQDGKGGNTESFAGDDPHRLSWKGSGIQFTGQPRLPKKFVFGIDAERAGFVTIDGEKCRDPAIVRTRVAKELATELVRAGAKAMWLSVSCSVDHSQYGVDGRYPIVLTECLKLLFSFFVRGPDRTASVYIATKRSKTDLAGAQKVFRRFGLLAGQKSKKGETYTYSSMTNHSAFLPVIDAHQFARGNDLKLASTLSIARGVTLSYKASTPRPAHYEWQFVFDFFGGRDRANSVDIRVPVLQQLVPDTWRHVHYFADELLEFGALGIYSAGGVVDAAAIFKYDLHPAGIKIPRSLSDLGRSLIWGDYEEAAKLYYLDVLLPAACAGRPRDNLERFVGAQLRAKATDRTIAIRMWRSLLICISGESVPVHAEPVRLVAAHAHPEAQDERPQEVAKLIPAVAEQAIAPIAVRPRDAIVRPYDEAKHLHVQRQVVPPLRAAGWTGRVEFMNGGLRLEGAAEHLALISQVLPNGFKAESIDPPT